MADHTDDRSAEGTVVVSANVTAGTLRDGDYGRVFIVIGWVCAAVIGLVTVLIGLPPGGRAASTVVILTAVGLISWIATLCTLREPSWILPCLAVTGACGAGLDAVHPSGPGYVLCYVAVSAIGLRRRSRKAAAVAALVVAAAATAEASVSPEPASSAIAMTIGIGFVYVATKFAGANRDATVRAQALHAQERATRAAQNEAAVLAERARLARELHDVLAHTLAGLAIQLEAARLLAEHVHADQRLTGHIATAHQLTCDGLVSARKAVAALRNDTPAGVRQLQSLIELTRRTTQLRITMEQIGPAVDLPTELDLVIYRTVQESLTNAAKYAGPDTTVGVSLRWSENSAVVEVCDDGGPAEITAYPSGGYGLAGLQERAALWRGRLEAGPEPSGWRVRLTLPLPAQRAIPAMDRIGQP